MIPQRVVETKRDGHVLSREELSSFLRAYLEDRVGEYQMAAFLMAVYFRGLDGGELDALVDIMIDSGETLDLSHLPGPRIDKHSTGGVGDKVSLVLAPLAAELGLYVPMMSGRGLGHTGGTLDKLEAVPGFRTGLSSSEAVRVLETHGAVMIGQTGEIAPLDRRLYDLRSVTGTVPALPLIAASIMSKKLAEGLSGLVLDVKVGSGAFLPEEERAVELARTMVAIGAGRGVPTVALLTAMDRPLGRAVGNALETREALECLSGGGPADLREVVLSLAVEMVRLGVGDELAEGVRARAAEALDGGGALDRFGRVVEAQGGDRRVVDDPDRLPRAPVTRGVDAPSSGWIASVDPVELGRGVVELGGGRTRLGEEIDRSVGFVLGVAPGDPIERGGSLGVVHASSEADARRGEEIVRSAVRVSEDRPDPPPPLLRGRIDAGGGGLGDLSGGA